MRIYHVYWYYRGGEPDVDVGYYLTKEKAEAAKENAKSYWHRVALDEIEVVE